MRNQGPDLRLVWLAVGLVCVFLLVAGGLLAPESLSKPDLSAKYLAPWSAFPMGTDDRGIPVFDYALQGAGIVAIPALLSGAFVAFMAVIAGLIRCAGYESFDSILQIFAEILGSLPRMVVLLVVAILLPKEWKVLLPIGLTWALLASPGAMDEAAATAGRLGGAHFVEALRAHGFSAARIYLYHVVWLNLRSVIVRQAAEVAMQVVFLEIALSYLAVSSNQPSFTHGEETFSWAILLYQGYTSLLGQSLYHSLFFGLALVGMTALMSQSLRLAARAR
jgi:ABC-type dipeptide/oligopeptide/nickel transport system permease subunit